MAEKDFKDWLKKNGWYIAAGGAIMMLGTGVLVGYWYGGTIITVVGEWGSAFIAALQNSPFAFTVEVPAIIKLGAFFGAASIERAKHF